MLHHTEPARHCKNIWPGGKNNNRIQWGRGEEEQPQIPPPPAHPHPHPPTHPTPRPRSPPGSPAATIPRPGAMGPTSAASSGFEGATFFRIWRSGPREATGDGTNKTAGRIFSTKGFQKGMEWSHLAEHLPSYRISFEMPAHLLFGKAQQ